MRKLIVVRAGDTCWEEEDRLQGTVSLPLTEAGKSRLDGIGAALADEGVCSLYSRGNESSGPTADYLAGILEVKARKMVALREMDCGVWQGLRIKDIQKRFSSAYKQWRRDPTSITPCQAESLASVHERVAPALATLLKKHGDKTAVVVAGQIVAAVIACVMTGTALEELWEAVDPASRVQEYEMAPGDPVAEVSTRSS